MTLPDIASAEAAHGTAATRHRTRALLRAARIVHPFPTLLNVAGTGGLALLAARGAPDAWTLLAMVGVMLCVQCAIGVANDYYDRALDAVAKPWKPIPAGLVSSAAAVALTLALIAVAAAVALTLGWASFGLAMLGLGCGLAYDVRLKRTLFSAVPFMVAIPVLPLWVWLTIGVLQPVCWWLLPLGALIGLALHLLNTLPDIEADAEHGVAGLAHRIGARWSMWLAWGAFAAALVLSAGMAPFVRYDLRWYVPTLACGVAALVVSMTIALSRWRALPQEWGFGLLSVASVMLAVGWLAAVT